MVSVLSCACWQPGTRSSHGPPRPRLQMSGFNGFVPEPRGIYTHSPIAPYRISDESLNFSLTILCWLSAETGQIVNRDFELISRAL